MAAARQEGLHVDAAVRRVAREALGASSKTVVLVLGDAAVGKTTLINTVVTDRYTASVERVMDAVALPEEVTMGEELLIIDTPFSFATNVAKLREKLVPADVAVLCYSLADSESFQRLRTYWLPEIDKHPCKPPVVLVGTKADLSDRSDEDHDANFSREVQPLLLDFHCVQMAMECTAMKRVNSVHEVFHYAARVVKFPVPPLLDVHKQEPTPRLKLALARLFRAYDRDADGKLSPEEIQVFQEDVYGFAMSVESVEDVRAVVAQEVPDGVAGDALTEEGFAALMIRFIWNNRPEQVWKAVERLSHKKPSLRIRPAPETLAVDCADDQVLSFSRKGVDFLEQVFHRYARGSGVLTRQQLGQVFAVDPHLRRDGSAAGRSERAETGESVNIGGGGSSDTLSTLGEVSGPASAADLGSSAGMHPFGSRFPFTTACTRDGALDMDAWLAQWSLYLLLEQRSALRMLHVLGYSELVSSTFGGLRHLDFRIQSAVVASSSRTEELSTRAPRRPVARAYVIGSKGCGKSSFVTSVLGRHPEHAAIEPTMEAEHSVVRIPSDDTRAVQFMAVTEWPSHLAEAALRDDAQRSCDIVCFCYDSSSGDSLQFVQGLLLAVPKHVPVVFAALQSDRESTAASTTFQQAEDTCVRYELEAPTRLSAYSGAADCQRFVHLMAKVVKQPDVALVITDEDREARHNQFVMRAVTTAIGLTVAAGAAYFGYRNWDSVKGKFSNVWATLTGYDSRAVSEAM